MLQNQRLAILDILDWVVKSCKGTYATKSKTGTLGLFMGLVKLVKLHATKSKTNKASLQNRL